MAGDSVVGDAVATLTRLQDQGVLLTTRSLQIMNIGKCAAWANLPPLSVGSP